MTPNPQQQSVIDWSLTGTGSANVIARAGCGKTSLLVKVAEALASQGRRRKVFMGAFNKAIAAELESRIPWTTATVKTMHGIGLKCFKSIVPAVEIDSRKVNTLARQRHAFDKKTIRVVVDAVGYAKQCGFGVGGTPYDNAAAWSDLLDYHELTDEIPSDISNEKVIESCVWVYKQSLEQCLGGKIDFNDMILAPLVFAKTQDQFRQFDWVMVDELQDQNHTRRILAERLLMRGGRFLGVGDPAQCQPAGTMVSMEGGGTVPIEKLEVGQRLIAFDQRGHQFCGSGTQGREVLEVSSRNYSGRVLDISVSSKTTTVTPNHKFFCKWSNRDTTANVTYLMRKGEYFRLGWCQLFQHGSTFHLGLRARLEEADEAWIVKMHDSKAGASLYESLLSTKYQIPLPPFKSHANAGLYTQVFLDTFWASIGEEVDLYVNADKLLSDHGRMIEFPFYSKEENYERRGRTTCFTTQACNMISGSMSVPVFEGTKRQHWRDVAITERHYHGRVYSLNVETHHNYVADGILTKNSIYGFAGADHDSMDKSKEFMKCIEFPLNVTYRCPKSIVTLAQQWVPDFTAHEDNCEGVISVIGDTEDDEDDEENGITVTPPSLQAFWHTRFNPDRDVILCRNRRPLVGIAKRFRKMGIQCVVEGGNGRGLISLAEKWGEERTIEELAQLLSDYRLQEVAKYIAKDDEERAEAIRDKVDILYDMMDGLDSEDTVTALIKRIERVFDDSGESPNLKLCTIHRSKGREWDRVFLIGRNRYMPSYFAVKSAKNGNPRPLVQEQNLMYVAVTRAKKELVEVNVPPAVGKNGQKAEKEWWEV